MLTAYEPCPATFSDVAVQLGEVWPDEHNFTDEAVNVSPAGVVSFENGVTDWLAPEMPVDVSAVAVGAGGGVTVGVIVARDFWPSESATAYLIGVAVPVNDARGSKVTTPVDTFSVYVPWLATVKVVDVHVDAVVTELRQIPDGTDTNEAPAPAESFDVGVKVWLTSHAPVPVSATAVGSGTTVGVIVAVAACPPESVIW